MSASNFGFPYEKPYITQLELMSDIYQAIENKQIGFFESPTGTGKTLSLLCGALSWLSDYYSQGEKNDTLEYNNTSLNEPEWLKKLREQKKPEPVPEAFNSRKYSKKVKIDTSNLDERISNLVDLLDYSEHLENKASDFRSGNFGFKSINPKIIFCSRTHSQLSQVVSELKKTSFFNGTHADSVLNFATSTGPRKKLCINKSVNNNSSTSTINEACKDLLETENGCPFYNREKDPAFKDHLDILASKAILDIEDILKFGSASQCCPYFSSRHLIQPASFVIAPYNAVLDKATRDAYGINLADNIIIFDEAHNIVDFVKQMNSIQIKNPNDLFVKILECIEDYLGKYEKRLRGSNVSALSQLKMFFSKISNFIKSENYGSYSANDFIYRAKIDSFNFSKLLHHAEETKLFTKVLGENFKTEIPLILRLLHSLEAGNQNGRFLLGDSEFKYICTDIVEIMSEISNQCRSVIFCGGTMSPLAETIKQILPTNLISRSTSKSLNHVIDPENINISFVSIGPSGMNMNFSYESRNNMRMIQELGIIVTNYARIIPAGLVVFFTSFSYMEQVIQIWGSKNILIQIEAVKKIFIEKKGEPSDAILHDYEAIINSRKGAIMFAVMGGKLSEGINFSDDLSRGIITIGIPFPNVNEIEIKEQMSSYANLMFESGSGKTRKELETDFLESSSMRILNQTIGRAIRHKNDFASIIMIDERINRNSMVERLPKWILPSICDRSGKFDFSFKSVSQAIIPWFPITMLQPLRRQGRSVFKRLSSTNHGHSEPGLHFENHRVEDAMPFNYDNKFTFALKLGAFSAVGLAIPVIGVWWNM